MIVDLKQAQALTGEERFAAYACLDTTGTREIFDVLYPRLDEDQYRIYTWNRAQQSPALTMALRGLKVDEYALSDAKKSVGAELRKAILACVKDPLVKKYWRATRPNTGPCKERMKGHTGSGRPKYHTWPRVTKATPEIPPLEKQTCKACGAPRVVPKDFEPTSQAQVMRLLYDYCDVPIERNKEGRPSVDGEALDRICRKEKHWQLVDNKVREMRRMPGLKEFCEKLMQVRDLDKQKGFFNATLSPTGRFHSSFNVAAPWTGRWSSSKNPYRWGGNLQNVGERHRHIFVPDRGYEMFYADLKTAESLQVAYLSGSAGYIEAHQGDVHTYVCRELWPDLPWTGNIKTDKKIAANNYPEWDNVPGHDFRFQSKRIQHGSNYGLTPPGIAMIAHIPIDAAKRAQKAYFTAFPEIKEWHHVMRERVVNQEPLYNALRRVVRLFGRPDDGHTFKQALAFPAQSGIGDVLNLGLWRLWSAHDCVEPGTEQLLQLLAQVHDAVLGQYRCELREKAIGQLFSSLRVDVPVTDIRGVTRTCTIPVEVAVGGNWGKRNTDPKKGPINANGLEEVTWPLAA